MVLTENYQNSVEDNQVAYLLTNVLKLSCTCQQLPIPEHCH
jgi:hypothetical protein